MRGNRANQFLPYDALKGFKEYLAEIDKEVVEKKELSEEQISELSFLFGELERGDEVTIVHYRQGQYVETMGIIKKIDPVYHKIYLDDHTIRMSDVLSITIH
ncbi:MAG: YolD-like family protein [Erysipelotrichaceae bacterium]|nr:YolD-like family protein [Erysipelotrichaceae bacterium]